MRLKMSTRLEVAANIITIAVLLFFVAVTLRREFFPGFMASNRHALQRGFQLPPIAGLTYEETEKTLLLVATSTCGYCRSSVPFYQEIRKAAQGGPGKTRVVFVSPRTDTGFEQFLRDNRLDGIPNIRTDLQGLSVTAATPAYIIVDRGGRVRAMWTGALADGVQSDIIRQL